MRESPIYWSCKLCLLFAALAGCAAPHPRPVPTLPPGLFTTLTYLGPDPVAAGPILFRLDLTNGSEEAFIFEPVGSADELSFEVTGPDGRRVPWIDIPRQWGSSGLPRLLEPGERAVLIESVDLAPLFLIQHRGRYQVRYTGCGAGARAARDVPRLAAVCRGLEPKTEAIIDELFSLSENAPSLPGSTASFELAVGRESPGGLLVARIFDILPRGWTVGITPLLGNPEVLQVLIEKSGKSKEDTARIELRLAGRAPEGWGAPISGWGAQSVYYRCNPKAAQLWPQSAVEIAIALAP